MEENLDEVGYIFKVSDGIVYARGLLKVQLPEMVRFEKEGENAYGMVNYFGKKAINKYKQPSFKQLKFKKILVRFYHVSNKKYVKHIDVINIAGKTINVTGQLINQVSNDVKLYISENKLKKDQSIKIKEIYTDHKYINYGILYKNVNDKNHTENVIATITSSSLTKIKNNQIDCSNKQYEGPIKIPTTPINIQKDEWYINNVAFKVGIEKIKSQSNFKPFSKEEVKFLEERKNVMSNKLDILKENTIIRNPLDDKYYLVPKKDIFYENGIIVNISFKNTTTFKAKQLAEFSFSVINDSIIINEYKHTPTDGDYADIKKFYEFFKD